MTIDRLTESVVRRILTEESRARLALKEARARAYLAVLNDARQQRETTTGNARIRSTRPRTAAQTSDEIRALVDLETLELTRDYETARTERVIVIWLMRSIQADDDGESDDDY